MFFQRNNKKKLREKIKLPEYFKKINLDPL